MWWAACFVTPAVSRGRNNNLTGPRSFGLSPAQPGRSVLHTGSGAWGSCLGWQCCRLRMCVRTCCHYQEIQGGHKVVCGSGSPVGIGLPCWLCPDAFGTLVAVFVPGVGLLACPHPMSLCVCVCSVFPPRGTTTGASIVVGGAGASSTGALGSPVWSSGLPFLFAGTSSAGSSGAGGLVGWGSDTATDSDWHGSSNDAVASASASLAFARSITDAEASLLAMQWQDAASDEALGYSSLNPLGINPVFLDAAPPAPPSPMEIRLDNIIIGQLVGSGVVGA